MTSDIPFLMPDASLICKMNNDFDPNSFRNRLFFQVRFSDLDAMGHVNNARYLTFFEEGRAHWFREAWGLPLESTAYPVIVARVELDYLAPIPFGEKIGVYHRVTEMGGKSMKMEGWVCMEGENGPVPASKYLITLVWFDYHAGKSIPIPDGEREKIWAFENGC